MVCEAPRLARTGLDRTVVKAVSGGSRASQEFGAKIKGSGRRVGNRKFMAKVQPNVDYVTERGDAVSRMPGVRQAGSRRRRRYV